MKQEAIALVKDLRERGVSFRVANGRVFASPRRAVPPTHRDRLAALKPDVLAVLETEKAPVALASTPPGRSAPIVGELRSLRLRSIVSFREPLVLRVPDELQDPLDFYVVPDSAAAAWIARNAHPRPVFTFEEAAHMLGFETVGDVLHERAEVFPLKWNPTALSTDEVDLLLRRGGPSRDAGVLALAEKLLDRCDPPPWLPNDEIKRAIRTAAEECYDRFWSLAKR